MSTEMPRTFTWYRGGPSSGLVSAVGRSRYQNGITSRIQRHARRSGPCRNPRRASEAFGLLRSALADLIETGEGGLAITTLQSLATQWLAPRLGGFQLAHPKIAVRLETTGRVVDLTREPFDLAIRSGTGESPGLEHVYLFPAQVTPLCSPALRVSCHASWGQLAPQTMGNWRAALIAHLRLFPPPPKPG